MTSKKLLRTGAAVTPLVFLATGAWAQDAAPATTGADVGLEEIVVTAQRRSENLQNVPISVTAVTGETLTASAIGSQVSLPQVTPNMQIQALVNYVSPYLRGVGTSFANPGLEQTVAIYLDDAYLSRASSGLFAFSDVERVEVLKGPQGTLYGRNSPAGTIRIITKNPTKEFEAGASATIGNYDQRDFGAYISGPLSSTLGFRLAVNKNDRDGYITRNSDDLPKLGDRDELFVLGKLLWEPTDRLSVKLGFDYGRKDDFAGSAFLPQFNRAPEQVGIALGGTPSRSFYNAPADAPHGKNGTYLEVDYGAQLRINYETDWATLSSITAYRKLQLKHGVADLDTTDLLLNHYWQSQFTKDYTQEFQAVSATDGPLSWVAGVYILHEATEFDGGVFGALGSGDPGPVNNTLFASHARVEVDSVAPYGQASYKLNDQFEVTAGARYTIESKKLKFSDVYTRPFNVPEDRPVPGSPRTFLTGFPGPNNAVFGADPDTLSFKSFTPRLVLNYTPNEDVLLFLSYSKGFKSGGYNIPAFFGADTVLPEKLDSYEFGWKTEFGPIRFNGSAFYYDYKDIQVSFTSQENNGTIVENAANARIKGVEAEVTWAAAEGLEIALAGGYLDPKYKNFETASAFAPTGGSATSAASPACVAARADADPANDVVACSGFYAVNPFDFSGNRMVLASKWTGNARVTYQHALGNLGSLTFNGIASYSSKFFFDTSNLLAEKARTLFNASVAWTSADERFSVAAFGENLTKEKYNTQQTFQEQGGWRVPGPPRFYGVRLSVKY